MAKTETYAAATKRLLAELERLGWGIKPYLKIPYAHDRSESVKIKFHPQAVYAGEHSSFLDRRRMSVHDLLRGLARDLPSSLIGPTGKYLTGPPGSR